MGFYKGNRKKNLIVATIIVSALCLLYLLLYHVIAVINAIIICLVFPDSTSVGASAGIFGMIGIIVGLLLEKKTKCE